MKRHILVTVFIVVLVGQANPQLFSAGSKAAALPAVAAFRPHPAAGIPVEIDFHGNSGQGRNSQAFRLLL